ncbi:hypothetical protein [Hansschlegelia zhihuaiae]|uniref:Uncharacterized protein n=1 Tax=Hansschlegelia zhihuaiae TaxID=405005 RepID=A0A4Q0MLY6_9HYPH|nr:hypothetical protein [Hansschlegelia zhihuaiae]RXF74455.1 hypothetical protein EK403_06515 [Hansschlegelia zhihuaiae]
MRETAFDQQRLWMRSTSRTLKAEHVAHMSEHTEVHDQLDDHGWLGASRPRPTALDQEVTHYFQNPRTIWQRSATK